MLFCGIIDELKRSTTETHLLAFFYCQATDSRINNATAVLRGLLYLLIDQQPSLISHIQKQHDLAGKTLFEDANAWVALSDIYINVLQDPSLKSTYLIIDALDECIIGLPKLLDFIIQKSPVSPHVKWLVSSRNWPTIEEQLERAGSKVRLCLELNAESISTAVGIYIRHKVHQLAQEKEYDNKTRKAVLDHLSSNANNTFLWVALVYKNLQKVKPWNVLARLNEFPPGLDSLYERMMEQINNSDDADLCKRILASIATVYRPIMLKELTSLVDMPGNISHNLKWLAQIIGLCGSFLTIREDIVYFVHQSAKDYLTTNVFATIFPSGREDIHYEIFSRSLHIMSRTLRRDIYDLHAPGYLIEQVTPPDPDPLAASRYSCIYWIDHLCDWNYDCPADQRVEMQDGVEVFMRKKFLYWLEALSLCRSMPRGVVGMAKLEALIQRADRLALLQIVRDARRFIMYHKQAIQISPLQAYASALIFSPADSIIRRHFKMEEPKWITIKPTIGDKWSACLQTLEGHGDWVSSVAFSHDSTRLASASKDGTVRIWDASSGDCLQTLEGHSHQVNSVAFSHDSTRLASASYDGTVRIWDASSGDCLQTLKGHSRSVTSVAFSHDSTRLASASDDCTVRIWDASSSDCLQTLVGHSRSVTSVAFSHDSTRLASVSDDCTVRIWDASSADYLQTLKITLNGYRAYSVVFSHDSTRLASAFDYGTIRIWDASSSDCLRTLERRSQWVFSVAFSHDSTRLASASEDGAVRIWNIGSGDCLQTLEGHSGSAYSVAFSHDSTRLASASSDCTVRIWDASGSDCLQTPKHTFKRHNNWVGHSSLVRSVAFSHSSARLASTSYDGTVMIWDASSGDCLQKLKGHNGSSVAFSHDSTLLASGSDYGTIRIWDVSSTNCLQTLEHTLNHHSDRVRSVAFSHDSTRLASASSGGTVMIWDTNSGDCLQTLKGYCDSVTFSHDSTRLASASHGRTIRIWDASSGDYVQTREGHSCSVSSVAFSHDSTRLASASYIGTVRIWDTSSGDCLQTLSIGKALYNISFDTTGSYLHTDIGTIAVDAPTVSHITRDKIERQTPRFHGVGLSPNGKWITYNSENLVWLPSEHRPSHSDVSGRTIGIGVSSGKVWVCSLQVTDFEHC